MDSGGIFSVVTDSRQLRRQVSPKTRQPRRQVLPKREQPGRGRDDIACEEALSRGKQAVSTPSRHETAVDVFGRGDRSYTGDNSYMAPDEPQKPRTAAKVDDKPITPETGRCYRLCYL